MTKLRFRVWCLSWDETAENGYDVVAYDICGPLPDPLIQHGIIYVGDTTLRDAASAAEAYADYVHNADDDASWPLTFRVCSADGAMADFEVYRDYVVTFSAVPVMPAQPVAAIEAGQA